MSRRLMPRSVGARCIVPLLAILLVMAQHAAPLQIEAQSDCGPNLRCGQVPWQLPVMPILVSPTPFATSVPEIVQPTPTPLATNQSANVINVTPTNCPTQPADVPTMDTPYLQAVMNSRPSAYWPLDEPSGAAALDASGGGRQGTYSGVTLGAHTVAGGLAPSFDGVNDQMTAPNTNALFNSAQFTVSLWMLPLPNWQGSGVMAWFGDGSAQTFGLARNRKSVIMYSGTSNTVAGVSTLLPNPWIHVAAVINRTVGGGQSARLYLNGVSVATSNTAPGTFTSSTFHVGSNGSGSFYPGGIGHVAIWNRALSASEVSAIANAIPDVSTIWNPDPCTSQVRVNVNVEGITGALATLQSLPVNQVGVANPQAGFDTYSGTATFFSYVLGIQSVNLGIFTPIIGFIFWSFFSFVAIKVAFILLPIVAGLIGVVRRIIQLVLDFLPL